MKQVLRYGGIVFLFYLVFLLVTFPASRAYSLAKERMPQVVLYDVSGTIWSGKADTAVINGKPLREFEWSLRFWRLLLAMLEADIKFDNNVAWAVGTVGLNWSGNVVVTNLEGQWPTPELQTMLFPMSARLDGIFRLQLGKLIYSPEQKNVLFAEGHIDWQEATVTVVQEAAIGDFQLDLTTTDAGINGVYSDINDGPLMVQGSVTLSPEKQYQLDAKLKVRDTTRQDLVQSLRFLGKMDPQGNVTVNKSGML